MGQTLTHGVYLPDEGERNCYNGLAANWQLLDNSVGTIAEHTTQISGKAPAVHTHTKADITDFPAYGNAAGTICEGNDARLSDARTPVAHTHVTADVTDLLSGDHTWSGNNTYSKTVAIERSTDTGNFFALKNTVAELGSTPASATPVTIAYRDKNDDNLGYMGVYYDTDGSNHFRLYVRNKFTSGAPSTSGSYDYAFFGLRLNADKSKEGIIKATFRPYDNNTHDLGSSSYQWNNVYSKGYYYNGVAWGLDQANVWTNIQRMTNNPAVWYLRNNTVTLGSAPPSNRYIGMFFEDVNGADLGYVSFQANKNGYNSIMFSLRNSDGTNAYTGALRYRASTTGAYCFLPENSECDLGDSTNKWKSLNGINPGALSLPDYNNVLDVTSEIPIASLDGNTQININDYLADKTGWLSIAIDDTAGNSIIVTQGKSGGATAFNNSRTFHTGAQSNGYISVFFPIIAGTSKIAFIKAASLIQMRFYYCLGNV